MRTRRAAPDPGSIACSRSLFLRHALRPPHPCPFSAFSSPQLIVASFVVLWGVRLGWYLVVRVLQVGEDSRFRNVKGRFAVFLLYWTIQVCGTAAAEGLCARL